jgi:hypothetical protein
MSEESLIRDSLKLAVIRVWDETMIVIWMKNNINEIVCRRLTNSLLNNVIEHISKSVIVCLSSTSWRWWWYIWNSSLMIIKVMIVMNQTHIVSWMHLKWQLTHLFLRLCSWSLFSLVVHWSQSLRTDHDEGNCKLSYYQLIEKNNQ